MRVVLDVNIIVSALISRDGTPARVLKLWSEGMFELVVSPKLIEELSRALAYPKLRRHVEPEEAMTFVRWLGDSAILATDPQDVAEVRSADPDDDYLLALAIDQRALLVSGDKHLLALAGESRPIYTPAELVTLLEPR